MSLAVGATVWVFDQNHRIYAKAPEGKIWADGRPIWREHWRPVLIVGETKRSWELARSFWIGGKTVTKFPKNDIPSWVVTSEVRLDDACFVHEHAYKISEEVRKVTRASLLRHIAGLVEYKVEEDAK